MLNEEGVADGVATAELKKKMIRPRFDHEVDNLAVFEDSGETAAVHGEDKVSRGQRTSLTTKRIQRRESGPFPFLLPLSTC